MRYTCDLVQDLYPLYETGDISPAVKDKVDEHLQDCESCRSIFISGKGFQENAQLNVMEMTIPESLDTRVRLTLKVRRLKILLTVLVSVFVIIGINLYQIERNEVFSAYNKVYSGAQELESIIHSAPEASGEELSFMKDIFFEEMYEGVGELTDSLNLYEDLRLSGLGFYIKQESFYSTLDNLNLRKMDGRWDEIDQKTYDLLIQYAERYMNEVTEDYEKFHHGYSSYFHQVDVSGLSRPIEDINNLTYTYNRFHKLPDQVQPLTEKEVQKKIASFFEVDQNKVKVDKDQDGPYRFEIRKRKVSGEVDAYSGQPISMDYYGAAVTTGKLLEVDQVQEKVKLLLNRIYGEGIQFSIEYQGINVNYYSNIDDQYYSFAYKLTSSSFPISPSANHTNMFYFDARTGDFRMMQAFGSAPLTLNYHESYNNVITPEQGLDVIKNKVDIEDKELARKREYDYVDTYIIYSSTSGGYVPVHTYALSDHEWTRRYINTETGKEEILYTVDLF